TALQDAGRCPQGADGVRNRLRPGPAGRPGGEPAAGRRGGEDQLRGRDALVVVIPARHAAAGPGGQPDPSGSGGAALPEAACEEVCVHDPIQVGPAATPASPTGSGLTSCHSGTTSFARSLTPLGCREAAWRLTLVTLAHRQPGAGGGDQVGERLVVGRLVEDL